MSLRLPRGAVVLLALFASGSWLGCGGTPSPLVPATPPAADEWPAPAPPPSDAVDVSTALASVDGASIRVRAYLVAVTLPCPVCSAGERRGTRPEPPVGKSARPRAPTMPGCLPCPSPAATFSGEEAAAAHTAQSQPLRAVGAAEALQPRHVGGLFLLTGVFHAQGATGPELDVTDVRALER